MDYKFEPMSDDDRTAVIDIMNYFVDNSFAAYSETRIGYDSFDRFMAAIGDYPAETVKTVEGGVIGFGFLRAFREADSFRGTAEITYFIMPEHTGQGLGTRILNHFIDEAKARGISIFLASISSLNDQSIEFHRKHGFVECGRFRGIGVKHGKIFDMVWMQKQL